MKEIKRGNKRERKAREIIVFIGIFIFMALIYEPYYKLKEFVI